jgi:hypothetical protein
MKRILLLLLFTLAITSVSFSQEKDKVKKTTTVGQKVHNTVSHHKHYKGTKKKHKKNGHTTKRKHDNRTGETKVKKD